MSLFVASLNSGSNGNCYYVGNQHEAVLIDGGISCRETELRMKRLGLSLKKVRAIFVTHEHFDHTKGIPTLSKKYQLPIYITSRTMEKGRLRLKEHLIFHFAPYERIIIGGLTITGFPKLHDAIDPHSFMISNETVRVGIFTDIGLPCNHVINHFNQCHAAILEANYDEQMLEEGVYPTHLKNRIRNGEGHLSNRQAADLFLQHKPSFMSHLFLGHLSKNNNTTLIVENLFNKISDTTEIIIASRYRETALYAIHANSEEKNGKETFPGKQVQISLF